MACQHEDFEANVAVGRITDDDGGDAIAFVAEVRVRCVDCGVEFGFRGMDPGLAYDSPTRSPDALEARLPLLTPTELAMNAPLPGLCADPPPPPMPSFSITVR